MQGASLFWSCSLLLSWPGASLQPSSSTKSLETRAVGVERSMAKAKPIRVSSRVHARGGSVELESKAGDG